MTTIKTMLGDTWDKVSLRAYSSENFMDKLIEANPEQSKKFIFEEGVFLNVPEIDIEAALVNESLPPWKR